MLSVLVADRHPLFRRGLVRLILSSSEFELVGESADWTQAEAIAAELEPDIAIVALNLPGLREHLPTADLLSRLAVRRVICSSMTSWPPRPWR